MVPFRAPPEPDKSASRLGRFPCVALGLAAVIVLGACGRTRPNTEPPRQLSAAQPPGAGRAPAPDTSESPDSNKRPRLLTASTGSATLDYVRSRELMVPVDGIRVAQVPDNFSSGRSGRAHNAHDIMAKRGTPVLSADDGRVIRLSDNKLGGLTIYATDPEEKLVYYYAHLDRYESGLKAGAKLTKGDVIGYVGSTGNASPSAPHLHFQVARMTDIARHWEGEPINARRFFTLDGAKTPR